MMTIQFAAREADANINRRSRLPHTGSINLQISRAVLLARAVRRCRAAV